MEAQNYQEKKYFVDTTTSQVPVISKEPEWCNAVRSFAKELVTLNAIQQEEALTFLKNTINELRAEKKKEIEDKLRKIREEAEEQMRLLEGKF